MKIICQLLLVVNISCSSFFRLVFQNWMIESKGDSIFLFLRMEIRNSYTNPKFSFTLKLYIVHHNHFQCSSFIRPIFKKYLHTKCQTIIISIIIMSNFGLLFTEMEIVFNLILTFREFNQTNKSIPFISIHLSGEWYGCETWIRI